ncbi:MAG: ribonuclease P protein component [Rickettsiales bacterium]|jgi:ribonuclease P protein component
MILISIKKRPDFLKLSKSTIRFHSKTSLVLAGKIPEKYLINPHTKKPDDICRLGVTVSKKVGNAVVRNKNKRRFRDIFAKLHKENCAQNGFDYVIIAKNEITNFDFKRIQDDVKFCLKHINRIIKENDARKSQKN